MTNELNFPPRQTDAGRVSAIECAACGESWRMNRRCAFHARDAAQPLGRGTVKSLGVPIGHHFVSTFQ